MHAQKGKDMLSENEKATFQKFLVECISLCGIPSIYLLQDFLEEKVVSFFKSLPFPAKTDVTALAYRREDNGVCRLVIDIDIILANFRPDVLMHNGNMLYRWLSPTASIYIGPRSLENPDLDDYPCYVKELDVAFSGEVYRFGQLSISDKVLQYFGIHEVWVYCKIVFSGEKPKISLARGQQIWVFAENESKTFEYTGLFT